MGTDGTMIIERKLTDGFWEPIGVLSLPRNYALFDAMKERGYTGYPSDIDELSKNILDTNEEWGEGYMSYQEWVKLLKEHHWEYLNTIKKKYYDDCRVIFRFDN